eukprot:CAMPEP_0171280616 /NCGR_PEP_ID=MMETSP0790-20130122/65985_1 /TAXON_ID=2925 /ORGANISM="Alexandrium catenella, Strain OF101" /LENGTH=180 /DNA_ID=CAMNT_0011749827 /DNA_START=267 /DNA_END=805 /DNA_ORIENTATION=-
MSPTTRLGSTAGCPRTRLLHPTAQCQCAVRRVLLDARVVHGRLVGLVPTANVVVQVPALGIAEVVHAVADTARGPRHARRASRGYRNKCPGRDGYVNPRDWHNHCLCLDVVIQPILLVHGPAMSANQGLTDDVLKIPPGSEESERHWQHRAVGRGARRGRGEKREGEDLTVKLDERLVLA